MSDPYIEILKIRSDLMNVLEEENCQVMKIMTYSSSLRKFESVEKHFLDLDDSFPCYQRR